jgi:hypothetical protein
MYRERGGSVYQESMYSAPAPARRAHVSAGGSGGFNNPKACPRAIKARAEGLPGPRHSRHVYIVRLCAGPCARVPPLYVALGIPFEELMQVQRVKPANRRGRKPLHESPQGRPLTPPKEDA